ncbi:efflux RND transporter periplasmic adaptor subunit [Endozoicomonas sp.]|uniref:efflux RND transporter periplasmic adaptor subunit n=1 Tax=Endozoicomonas sp. TaxID=1892382 RepID=UPI00383A532D
MKKRVLLPFLSITLYTLSVNAEDKPPVAVQVQPVSYQEYAQSIQTSGILSYKSQQTLSFKTAGPVTRILVEAGNKVTKGQLLASLALDEIDAQVDEAEARVSLAKKNLKRFQQLHKTNVLSLEKLQSAETELTIAESKLRITKFNRAYSSIHASATGLVLQRHAEPNELVSPYQPILVVADQSKGWVIRSSITDQDIVRMALGDKASIRFDALPDQAFSGSVTQMTPLASSTGTFEIEISLPVFDSPIYDSQLRSGFVGQIAIQPSTSRKVALIPVSAIIQSEVSDLRQTAKVLILNQRQLTAEQRTVSLAYLDGGMAAITGGITQDEILITTGAGLLRHGEKVSVIDSDDLATQKKTLQEL